MAMTDICEHEDRLSELPDSLIFHVFGLLRTVDVVRTTILSNRWKNLWTTFPCLTFDYSWTDYPDPDRLRNFVNGALKLWGGIKILKFKLDLCVLLEDLLFSDIDSWVRFAHENEVEELCLHLLNETDVTGDGEFLLSDLLYWLPQYLYSCSSLKELFLQGCCFHIERGVQVQWNQLKSLTIDDAYHLDEHVITKVLSGCPQLEVFVLTLSEICENLSFTSSSLKKLMIKNKFWYTLAVPSKNSELRIWAPNLVTLEMCGVAYAKCLLTNVSSLTHLTLDFSVPPSYYYYEHGLVSWTDVLGGTLSQIFPSIQHVERVTLSHWCIKVVGAMKNKYLLPTLSNVNCLELKICPFMEYERIVDGLEIFPQLKTLAIETKYNWAGQGESNLDLETNLPRPFLLQLRTVDATWTKGDTSLFPLIEFVLKHARRLEKMVFRKRNDHKKYDMEVFHISGSGDENAGILRPMQS